MIKINATQRLQAAAVSLDPAKLNTLGWFLEVAQKSWIEDKDVTLVMVPTIKCYQWEYKAYGGLKKTDKDVISIAAAWDAGRKLPVITGTAEGGVYRINDGQHRWVAWQLQTRHPNKFIPMLLNT